MRSIWEHYYNEANAIVYVIDSADAPRLEEARIAFDLVSKDELLSNVPILTIANKQDLPGALSPPDLAKIFYPAQDVADRTRVFAVSAISGDGIDDALSAIVDEAIVNARIQQHR